MWHGRCGEGGMAMVTGSQDTAASEAAVTPPEPSPTSSEPPTEPNGPRPEPQWLTVNRPMAALIDDIRLVRPGGKIVIFCGEAHPDIYNKQKFLKAIRWARWEQEARIEVITGPILLVPEDRHETNGLLKLWDEETICKMYMRRARTSAAHFRVVETDLKTQEAYRLYLEAPHPPLLPQGQRHCQHFSRLHRADVHQRALHAMNLFEGLREQAVLMEKAKPGSQPMVTTPDRLKKILNQATDHDLIFDFLDEARLRENSALPLGQRYLIPYPDF